MEIKIYGIGEFLLGEAIIYENGKWIVNMEIKILIIEFKSNHLNNLGQSSKRFWTDHIGILK